LGEKVLEKQIEGVQNTLDISEIAQGTYILRIEQGQNLVSQSILVE
ncbi:MAG: hypothetical protein RLZZ337_1507, partial [Bacteroidota bacterium]